jgi:hypothetical protein
MSYWINTKLVTYLSFSNDRQLDVHFGASVLVINGSNQDMDQLREAILNQGRTDDPWLDLHKGDYSFRMLPIEAHGQ